MTSEPVTLSDAWNDALSLMYKTVVVDEEWEEEEVWQRSISKEAPDDEKLRSFLLSRLRETVSCSCSSDDGISRSTVDLFQGFDFQSLLNCCSPIDDAIGEELNSTVK